MATTPATERLYYDDCYLKAFEATATVADDGRVYLDRTAFYPTSGGQPHDLGRINGQPVIDVIDEADGAVVHVMDAPISPGPVVCDVNWPRRYDHMQQHTAQHLLSAVFSELFSYPTVSFHLGPSVSTVELKVRDLSEKQIEEAEARANAIAAESRPVIISYDDAETVEGLRKPSSRAGKLRIITIEKLDRSACGGTHVRSTAELGPIQVRGIEKIRGNVRIEYVAGQRALRRAKQDYRIAATLSRSAAVGIDELPGFVGSLQARSAQAEKERRRLATELAQLQGRALYLDAQGSADGIKRMFLEVPSVDDAVRAKLQSFAGQGRAIAVAAGENPPGVAVACSIDSGVHAGNALRSALTAAGGSGGGSATLAQGSLPDRTVLQTLLASLGFDATG
ncbi:MAG TPA: alanyl-tRNA editing protein [Bryobacteraceae bacterium]|nr:alanyl-tRNA editing protein [Bryobacteraceae bacterium]